MTIDDKIKKINEIRSEITEANIIRGDGSRDILGVIKLKHESKISIFGSRWFGVGTHINEIVLPTTMVDDIQKLMMSRCKSLHDELSTLL